MALDSFNFFLSKKLFISPLILKELFAGYSNLGCRFFSFSTWNISCHSLLAYRVSAEWSAIKSMRCPLYVTCCFSLAAFNILYLNLVFVSLISMCLGMFLLGFILYGALCASWTLLAIFFSMLGMFSTIISSTVFPYPSLFFFWDAYNLNVDAFDIVPVVSEAVLSSFHSFYFILVFRIYFHHFIFQVTDSFCFRYSAIDSFQSIFNLSNCVVCMFIL